MVTLTQHQIHITLHHTTVNTYSSPLFFLENFLATVDTFPAGQEAKLDFN